MDEIFVTTQNKEEFSAKKEINTKKINAPDPAGLQEAGIEQKRVEQQKISAFQQVYANHMDLGERLARNYYKGKDGDKMKVVKQHMKNIGEQLSMEMSGDRQGFTNQLRALAKEYDSLLHACDQYLNHHSLFGPAKERKKLVEAVMRMAEHENLRIRDMNGLQWLTEHHKEGMLLGNVLGLRIHEEQYQRDGKFVASRFNIDKLSKKDPNEKYRYEFSSKKDTIEWEAVSTVGTSRLAEFLGMGKSARECSLAVMKNRVGETHYGYRYRGAYCSKAEDGADVTMEQLKKHIKPNMVVEYTGDSLRQLNSIKLLNILTGGVYTDFEREIKLVYSKKKLGEKTYLYITGSYLDPLSRRFSARVTASELSKGMRSIPGNTLASMPLVDDETATKILQMTTEDAQFLFGDILNKKQMAAFSSRLRYMQDQIRKRKEDEIGREDFLKQEDWHNTDNIPRIKQVIRSGNRHLMKGFFNGNTRMEGDSGEHDNAEIRYEALYQNLRKQIEKKPSLTDKLLTIANLTYACEKGEYRDHAYYDDGQMIMRVVKRLQDECMTPEMIEDTFEQRVAAAKALNDAFAEESNQDKELPEDLFDPETVQEARPEDRLEMEREWTVYKVVTRHTGDYRRFLVLSSQLKAFRKAANKSMDAKLNNTSDYLDVFETRFLKKKGLSEGDFIKQMNEAASIGKTFSAFKYLKGQEVESVRNGFVFQDGLLAVEQLPDEYKDELEDMDQHQEAMKSNIQMCRDSVQSIRNERQEKKERAAEKKRQEEERRKQEEERERLRKIEEERKAEEARKAEEEKKRLAEEQRKLEEQRRLEEERKHREEQKRLEEARKAEEKKKAEKEKWGNIATREYEIARAKNMLIGQKTGLKFGKSTRHNRREEVITGIDDQYREYKLLDDKTAMKMEAKNPAKQTVLPHIASAANIYNLNTYIKNKEQSQDSEKKNKAIYQRPDYQKYMLDKVAKEYPEVNKMMGSYEKWRSGMEDTASELDKVTQNNTLSENTRLFQLVPARTRFFQETLHLDQHHQILHTTTWDQANYVVNDINSFAGKHITEQGFMRASYQVDPSEADNCPILVSVLADKGTKCYVTNKTGKANVIFGQNTHYILVGARLHSGDGIQLPSIETDNEEEHNKTHSVMFTGLEVILKIINDDEQAEEGRKAEEKKIEEQKQAEEGRKAEEKKTGEQQQTGEVQKREDNENH